MSPFLATAVVDVLRGTTTDSYGDAADVDTVVAAAIPVSIVQRVQRGAGKTWAAVEERPASDVIRTTRSYLGRAAAGIDIRDQDRLRDNATGTIYLVEGTSDPTGIGIGADLRLDLTRVT